MNLDLEEVLGCICEVNTVENELLAIGKISAYAPESGTVDIVPCDGGTMPDARYMLKVKINIFSSKHGFVGLDGLIYIAHGSFWRIFDVRCFGKNERRSYFRIRTRSKAKAQELTALGMEDPNAVVYPCQVINVSISGLLLSVEDEACDYKAGTKLQVNGFTVDDSGQIFSAKCHVERLDWHEKYGHLYGCSFYQLKDMDVERLCRAIFARQRTEILRRRGMV